MQLEVAKVDSDTRSRRMHCATASVNHTTVYAIVNAEDCEHRRHTFKYRRTENTSALRRLIPFNTKVSSLVSV